MECNDFGSLQNTMFQILKFAPDSTITFRDILIPDTASSLEYSHITKMNIPPMLGIHLPARVSGWLLRFFMKISINPKGRQ